LTPTTEEERKRLEKIDYIFNNNKSVTFKQKQRILSFTSLKIIAVFIFYSLIAILTFFLTLAISFIIGERYLSNFIELSMIIGILVWLVFIKLLGNDYRKWESRNR
jgi:hypothetical protein